MELRPAAVRHLMEALELLPGVGPRTAARLVHHLLRRRAEAERLAASLVGAAQSVHYCPTCYLLTDSDPCAVCADPGRDRGTICVLEDPLNAWSVEATGEFRGLYHILLGVLDPLHGVGPDELTVEALLSRARVGDLREIILATNPTVEGEATAHFLAELLRPTGVRLSRIAFGLPAGGEISYADHVTLTRAISGRRGMD
jgi:recombination protein RecR